MPGPARIALFAAVLAALFAGAFALGSVLDPNVRGGDTAAEHGEAMGDGDEH